jgi:hypothetical protein
VSATGARKQHFQHSFNLIACARSGSHISLC